MRCLALLSPKTGMSPSVIPVHSFQPLVLVRHFSTVGGPSLPWHLAVRVRATTTCWSPGTSDHQHWCSVATHTVPTWTWNQGMQTYRSPTPLPVCQPFQTYWPKDLGLSFLDAMCTQPLISLEIQIMLSLPVGLLESGDLTITQPLFSMLLEVSKQHVHSPKATKVKGLTIAFIIPLGMLTRDIWINLLLISFFQVFFSMETIMVWHMQRDLLEFCHWAERVGLSAWVERALNFRAYHHQDVMYK